MGQLHRILTDYSLVVFSSSYSQFYLHLFVVEIHIRACKTCQEASMFVLADHVLLKNTLIKNRQLSF